MREVVHHQHVCQDIDKCQIDLWVIRDASRDKQRGNKFCDTEIQFECNQHLECEQKLFQTHMQQFSQ